jgi:hypothetical protein
MRKALIILVVVLVSVTLVLVIPPGGPRTLREFDPERTAELEVDMWQAYYARENIRLFRGLVMLTHDQYRYSWIRAFQASFHLARAAATFGNARSNYEQVLPDLEAAYTIAHDWTGARYDPAAVARAELAWWVARRIPAESSPENVGRLIAEVNAMVYGVRADRVLEASVLRARAGRLRDEGGPQANWPEVSRLLHESYRMLHAVLH